MAKQGERGRFMDDWIRVPLCKPGEKLYHYTAAEGVYGIVKNRQFIATKSDFLNDKMEFLYALAVMEDLTKTYIVNETLRQRFLLLVQQEVEALAIVRLGEQEGQPPQEDTPGFYVVSFSKQENSALLWAEFTDFKGYSVGFDYAALVEGFRGRAFLHGTVIYDEAVQTACLLEAFLACLQGCVEKGMEDLADFFEEEANPSQASLLDLAKDMAVICSVYAMFFKQSFFAGEEEYRFIFSPLGEAGEARFRIAEQVFLPYIMVEYDEKGAKMPLESVMVGAKNNSDIALRGVRAFLREEGFDIPVGLSDIPLRY